MPPKNWLRCWLESFIGFSIVGSFGGIPKSNFSRIGKNCENRLSFLEDSCQKD